ncbi:MAG: FIG021250: possible hydrolase [uncultured Nocardioidaceae bacterium]|uniref:FIG021250: possible hydrolase n=1 Tax=uncultured Nocardioidaceae bacterium TaxID=253824 RepID=A0A6J4MD72_9ACTN|nr:MAG: FIG021250: possible hydrolase [uncultured Nocardioidaceae bacterium]
MPEPRSAMVDWDLAVSTAAKLAGPGPTISRTEASAVVAELRAGAARSTPLVREFTGLSTPGDDSDERAGGDVDATTPNAPAPLSAPLLVVDRTGWIQANVDGFATIISPLIDRLREKKGAPGPLTEAIGSRVTGLELGALLGFMSSKVLGQFDPFFGLDGASGQPRAAGRLLLVAPNIVHVENELGVDPADFRLWVCLHEETHRVQFTAVPWMREHIHGEIANLVGSVEIDPAKLAGMVGEGVKRISDLVRGDDDVSLIDLVQTPEQKEVLDRITAVMSLLEGHADVVMDGVGPEVIPSVVEIRRKFNQRRKGAGTFDRILRKLLGLDAKMAQYRNGAAFVRGVVDQVGMDGLNKVWVAPENLPTRDEIGDPASWVRRVHG